MKTMFDEWQEYDQEIIPADAGSNQREECRRAFYAGARSALSLAYEAVDDRNGEDRLQALDDEVNQITKDLKV